MPRGPLRIRVDGYLKLKSLEKPVIFEYMGCYWHGYCAEHRADKDESQRCRGTGNTFRQLRINTLRRYAAILASKRFHLVFVWDCQFKARMRADERLRAFVGDFNPHRISPLRYTDGGEGRLAGDVVSGKVRGLVHCSVSIPQEDWPRCASFPPVFYKGTIAAADLQGTAAAVNRQLGGVLKSKRRMLLSGFEAEDMLFHSEYLRFLALNFNCRIFDIRAVYQWFPSKAFEALVLEFAEKRRLARDSIDAALQKAIVCSFFGRSIMSVDKNRNSRFTASRQTLMRLLNTGHRPDCLEMGFESPDDFYEITVKPRKHRITQPYQIGFSCTSHCKVMVLDFWYNFLNRHIHPSKIELLVTDTDSLYFCLSTKTLDEAVAGEQLAAFRRDKHRYLVMDPQTQQFLPGLWKTEAVYVEPDTVFVAIGIKNYAFCPPADDGGGGDKVTLKGARRTAANEALFRRGAFIRTLLNEIEGRQEYLKCTNKGFLRKAGSVFVYILKKKAMSPLVLKQFLLACHCHTVPRQLATTGEFKCRDFDCGIRKYLKL